MMVLPGNKTVIILTFESNMLTTVDKVLISSPVLAKEWTTLPSVLVSPHCKKLLKQPCQSLFCLRLLTHEVTREIM